MKKALVILLVMCMMFSSCPVLAEETSMEKQPARTAAEIVAAAYALEDGAELTEVTLTGTVTAVPAPYSEETNSVTVSIQVGELAEQLIQCAGLTGEGIAELKEGDEITVTGTIRNENGIFGFAEGCTLQAAEVEEAAVEEPVEEIAEEPADEPEQSAESLVLGFLSELGIETTGFEEKISSVVGEAKTGLTDLKSNADSLEGSVKEDFGGFMNNLSDSLNDFLHEVNSGFEQGQNTTASEIERIKGTLEGLLKDAAEKDPESEETRTLQELLKAAGTLVEDDAESVSAFVAKVMEILKKNYE